MPGLLSPAPSQSDEEQVSFDVKGALAGAKHVLPLALNDPSQWGLDFVFTAMFLALLVGLWKGKADLLPWIVAALAAVAAAHWLPGKWYILLGGVAGSLAGVVRHAD